MFEIVTASRPTTRSVASMTIHFGWTVLALAMNVDIVPIRIPVCGRRESLRNRVVRKSVMVGQQSEASSAAAGKLLHSRANCLIADVPLTEPHMSTATSRTEYHPYGL